MGKKTLYIECNSGIDERMLIAALLNLGISEDLLRPVIDSTGLEGFVIEVGKKSLNGSISNFFEITKESECGVENASSRKIVTNEVYNIISRTDISDTAKRISINAVNAISKANTEICHSDIEGSENDGIILDKDILTIIAAAFCIDQLNVDDVILSEISEGIGTVTHKGNIVSIPSPMIARMLINSQLSVKFVDVAEEMLSLVGTSILSSLTQKQRVPDSCRILSLGIGSEKKESTRHMRAMIIEEDEPQVNNETWILETNIDDSTGESLAFTMEKLLESGARDVFFTPIFMKKNRPAYKLSVTCRGDYVKKMESIIFKNTTTIGIKKYRIEKTVLEYSIINVDTRFGSVRVKVSSHEDIKCYSPEFEDIKTICNISGKGFKEISEAVDQAIYECFKIRN
ncbi:LarC family nickel insertion protein [Youngiibacter fragilis]|uniref:Nickel pincer cofactor biosynthesis protein LarC n=1 Tax=Youngiibacter fragilis 232.1 TaxID=994573 RepID=V7I5W1_9CLOT|nr:LarC family nickel insertion protein [Youngiibacter fragilis]ETA81590.1 hypothetical protein T472_0205845 [Youngiibacter fragilis 232.1]